MAALKDKLRTLDAQIESKTTEAKEAWTEFDDLRGKLADSDVDITDETSEPFQKAHEAHRRHGELADEVEKMKGVRESLWAMQGERGSEGPGPLREVRERIKDGLHSVESFGARVVASEQYKELKASGAFKSSTRFGRMQLGEMMSRDELAHQLSGGRSASVIVTDGEGADNVRAFIEPEHRGLVEPRFRPHLVRDLITVGTTDSDSIDYIVETGYVNNAAVVPEASTDAPIGGGVTAAQGGRKPQSRLSYEKRDAPVQTLAHWVAATRKSLGDVPRLRSTIEGRLRWGLDDVVEDEILTGDGIGDNLTGIYNQPGVQHQDNDGVLMEDILRGMTKVELAFFRVTATGINSQDWEDIRLHRDASGATADTGQYMFGPPSQAGETTLWGRPVVTGPQFPHGNPMVGDWRSAEFLIREAVNVLVSDSHEDFFTRNLVAILAEFQAGLIVPTPEAFCEISVPTS